MKLKLILAGLALVGLGMLAYFVIMFIGPHMVVQQHILGYQKRMPLPPKGMMTVEPDPYTVPAAQQANAMKNPLPDSQANRERGKTYYGYYCIFCHGENGQGDGPVGYSYMPVPTDLHAKKVVMMSDGDLFRGMLVGIGHEPVLPRVVLPLHRWYLVTYIRALGKTGPQPAENPGSRVLLRGPETR